MTQRVIWIGWCSESVHLSHLSEQVINLDLSYDFPMPISHFIGSWSLLSALFEITANLTLYQKSSFLRTFRSMIFSERLIQIASLSFSKSRSDNAVSFRFPVPELIFHDFHVELLTSLNSLLRLLFWQASIRRFSHLWLLSPSFWCINSFLDLWVTCGSSFSTLAVNRCFSFCSLSHSKNFLCSLFHISVSGDCKESEPINPEHLLSPCLIHLSRL